MPSNNINKKSTVFTISSFNILFYDVNEKRVIYISIFKLYKRRDFLLFSGFSFSLYIVQNNKILIILIYFFYLWERKHCNR